METLSSVCHAAVKRAPSGLSAEAVADLLGVKYNTMMQDLGRKDMHKPDMDWLIPLVLATGSDAPLKAIARACDCLFVPLPAAESGDLHPVVEELSRSVESFASLLREVGGALGDGRISTEEAKSISLAGHDVMLKVLSLVQLTEKTAL